jgi:hypothetical protein
VVVNADDSGQMAADRLSVKVVDPKVALQKVDGGIQMVNNSGSEINLEGWKLVSPNKSFTFPTDTLLPAGRSVTFADETTGINSGNLQLQNPLGKTYASISAPDFVMTADVAPTETTGTKGLDEISQSVADVAQKLVILKSEMNPSTSAENSPSAPAMSVSGVPVPKLPNALSRPSEAVSSASFPPTESSTTNNTDQTATVFIASSSPGIITRIFSWPIAGINFIRNLFIEK